jgi:hypothetical protein
MGVEKEKIERFQLLIRYNNVWYYCYNIEDPGCFSISFSKPGELAESRL